MSGAVPYSVRLDGDVAQQLADQGGALLVIGLPEGSYFGIDHMAFRCGPRFRGMKMLPPGPHFACYSVPGSEHRGGGMGPITGFFFHIATGPSKAVGEDGGPFTSNVIVRRYDAAEELLVELPEEEAERYARGVRRYEFDWGLAPYNLNAWRQWRELTTCLDNRVVDAIQPVGGNICTAAEAALDEQGSEPGASGLAEHPETEAEARLREQLMKGRQATLTSNTATSTTTIPSTTITEVAAAGAVACASEPTAMEVEVAAAAAGEAGTRNVVAQATGAPSRPLAPDNGRQGNSAAAAAAARPTSSSSSSSGCCFYSELPRLVKEAGLTPAQLTALNMDRSRQLEALAASRWCGEVAAVVGEMQFAFIAFVFGQSLQGFRQWRALVTLLLNCEEAALASHAAAFAAFLATLRAQLSLGLSDAGAAAVGPSANRAGEADGDVAAALGLATQGSSLVEEVLLAGGGRDCFLRHHLATWFEVLREAGPGALDPRLHQEAAQLRAVVSRLVGWQFDGVEMLGEDDDDEYAPVVVELGDAAATV